MAAWVLPILEAAALLLLAWCLADAWRRGPARVLELLAGGLFGLAVEQLAMALSRTAERPDLYRYGPFAWFVGDVPVAVVAAWGALLYAAMKYSDDLGVPHWVRPFTDGLYALMVDLSMEVVAVHLGLWQWAVPPGTQWFGAPYANFGGWLLLAILFSAGVRAVRGLTRRRGSPARLALQVVALATALAAGFWLTFTLGQRLFSGAEADLWPLGGLALVALAALWAGLAWRSRATPAQLAAAREQAGPQPSWPDPARGVPVVWHGLYLLVAVLSGVFLDQPVLLLLTGVIAAAGILLVLGLAPPRTPCGPGPADRG